MYKSARAQIVFSCSLGSPAPFQIMSWKQHTKDAATSKTSEFLKAWSWASLQTSLSFSVECCSNKKHFNCDWLAPPTLLKVFFFFLQKGRTWRFSLYLFYVQVNPLYTLRRNPAESVTVDFFIADPTKHPKNQKLIFRVADPTIAVVSARDQALARVSPRRMEHGDHWHICLESSKNGKQ